MPRSEERFSRNAETDIVCRLLLEKKNNAANGEQMRRGGEQAVKDLNAKGGVLGRKFALTIGDDACDPKQAVAVANKFAVIVISMVARPSCSTLFPYTTLFRSDRKSGSAGMP